MRILWDKELFTILDQEFLEFECERCIDEAKDWSELIVHKENSHGDLENCCWKHSFSSDHRNEEFIAKADVKGVFMNPKLEASW